MNTFNAMPSNLNMNEKLLCIIFKNVFQIQDENKLQSEFSILLNSTAIQTYNFMFLSSFNIDAIGPCYINI